MTAKKKALLILLGLCLLAIGGVYGHAKVVERSYFPMQGEVVVLEKSAEDGQYAVKIQQGGVKPAQFVLSCTQAQFQALEEGDVVRCARMQSVRTYEGVLEKIYTINAVEVS